MAVNGADADKKLFGDLAAGVFGGDKFEDIPLGGCQVVDARGPAL